MLRVGVTLTIAVLAQACVVGGGAYAGYGTRAGLVAGVEAGGGLPLAQASVGYQTGGFGAHGRLDLAYDLLGHCEGEPSPKYGGRIGYARSTGGEAMWIAGADRGSVVAFPEPTPNDDASGFDTWGVHVGLELRRLADEWLFVVTGRGSLRTQYCADSIPGAS